MPNIKGNKGKRGKNNKPKPIQNANFASNGSSNTPAVNCSPEGYPVYSGESSKCKLCGIHGFNTKISDHKGPCRYNSCKCHLCGIAEKANEYHRYAVAKMEANKNKVDLKSGILALLEASANDMDEIKKNLEEGKRVTEAYMQQTQLRQNKKENSQD